MNCSYCYNSDLIRSNESNYTEEEVLEFLKSRVGKVDGVVITGGEPTLDPTLPEFCDYLKGLGYKVKLDTNGTNPDVVMDLLKKGLIDYVAVDIKNSKNMYSKTIGLETFDLNPVERLVNFLIHSDYEYEFRTTLINEFHTEESIKEMGIWLIGAKRLFLQHFVDSQFVPDKTLTEVERKNALGFRRILEDYIKEVKLRGY